MAPGVCNGTRCVCGTRCLCGTRCVCGIQVFVWLCLFVWHEVFAIKVICLFSGMGCCLLHIDLYIYRTFNLFIMC